MIAPAKTDWRLRGDGSMCVAASCPARAASRWRQPTGARGLIGELRGIEYAPIAFDAAPDLTY